MAQTTVNGTAQETVDTLDYVWQWLLGVWDAMPLGLRAFALTVFAVSVLMEWVKRALLAGKPKRERVKLLWLASMPLGVALAAVGAIMAEGALEAVYWGVIGLTAGTTAMGLHYVTVKKVLPLLGWVWGRVTLVWRGPGA